MRRLHLCAAVCILASLMFFCSTGYAKTFVQNTEQPFSFRNGIQQDRFQYSMKMAQFSQSPFLAQEPPTAMGEDNVDIYGFKGKSLKRAFVYSLLIPGTGELYAGSKIKAVAFFGLDVGLWALYFSYHGKGKDKEDEYRGFADQHWFEDDYNQWLIDDVYINVQTPNPNVTPANVCDTFAYWSTEDKQWLHFSHHLEEGRTQQYYEMIGKYEQFSWGWSDYDGSNSGSRETYLGMRHDANDLLNKATYSAMFSLVNHILSAFDAAISVKRYNKRGEKFGQIDVKTRLVERQREVIPRLTVSLKF